MKYEELVEAKAKGVVVHTFDGPGTLNGLGQKWSYVIDLAHRRVREYNNDQIAVAIETNDQSEPMCPVCCAPLRGSVVESFYDVSLHADARNNVCWDTADGEQTEAELVAMSCHECEYVLPEHYKVI